MTDSLKHVSEKPWSDYTKADYSIEQWHAACLIHLHQGPPTSKDQCKVPVRTPNGALNRNGVHAAAAALAGARGGVQAPPVKLAAARAALNWLYGQLNEQAPPSIAQSAIIEDEDAVEHHGVKGMKWGVRRDRGHEGERAKTRKIAKEDKRFEKKAATTATWINLHNRAADLANHGDIDRINNKPQYKNKDFSKDSPLRRQYYNEHQQAYIKRLRQAAQEAGTNASGTRELKIVTDSDGNWGVQVVDVKHDAFDELDGTIIQVTYDSTGHITKIGAPKKSMAQTAIEGAEFLEHFGIKGMKWGVRRDRSQIDSAPHIPDAPEHIHARKAQATAKAHGTRKLSNKDLEELNRRLNLEQNYTNLTTKTKQKSAASVGAKWTGDVLNSVGKQLAAEVLKSHGAAQLKTKGIIATSK
jgi:hypothetical protein